jgi:hypothetical protein
MKQLLLIFLLATSCVSQAAFTLITMLYNETHQERMQEYKTCMINNLQHPLITHIHVLYDVSKDDADNQLLTWLQQQPVTISFVNGRQSYAYCFTFANETYPNQAIILCNADIYFNHTLQLLGHYDLTNTFIALTRWDVQPDGSLKIFTQYDKDGNFSQGSFMSQDAWIFKTPIRAFKNASFLLGTWACDCYIAHEAFIEGFNVRNPCLSVQCCHLHLSNLRTWVAQSIPGQKGLVLPWSYSTTPQ